MRVRRKGFTHGEGAPISSAILQVEWHAAHGQSGLRDRIVLSGGVQVHELSIVSSIVDSVTEALGAYPGARVKEVRLRIGALAAVVEDSLQFCFELATADTPLEGSKLIVRIVPVMMHCDKCAQDVGIESLQSFRCPRCGEPVADLRQGRELEIESIEIDEVEEKV